MTLPGMNAPLLIVGLGIVLIAAVLPWLTAGLSTDRRLRAVLGLGGLVACGLALMPRHDKLPIPDVPGNGDATTLSRAACVETLSRRMSSLTRASAAGAAVGSGAASSASGASATAPAPLPANAVGLVSGAATGTYHAMADNLVSLARQQGVPLFNRETQGSLENIRKLADPKENAALGFAQSDLLTWLRRSDSPEDRQAAALLRLVLPLHAEEVHVLARTEIRGLADLAGKRVLTAASSQGSRHTAENLLRARGIVPARLDSDSSAAESLCQVLTGGADAMVVVAGKPTPQLTSLEALVDHPARPLAQVHLLPLEAPSGSDGFEAATVDRQDYGWVREPVPTLAVRALLMAFDFSPRSTPYQRLRCQQLQHLGRLIESELAGLKLPPYPPKWREVDPRRPVSGWKADRCARLSTLE